MKKIELKSGFIKTKQNKTDSIKPSTMQFQITELKKGHKEEEVIDDALQLYLKTNFPGVTFKKVTDPIELEKADRGFKNDRKK